MSRDLLFQFRDPLISPEWLKIRTSNFACRLNLRDTKPRNEKWGKKGRGLGHVTYFSNFGTPSNISEIAKYTNLKFCMRIEGKKY